MKKLLFSLLILLQSPQLNADSLHITIGSKHLEPAGYDYEEFNPGLVYEKDLTKHFSLIAGGYRNSFGRLSAVAGVEAQAGIFGVQGGVATGYKRLYGHKLQPTGTVFVELPLFDRVKPRLSLIPNKNGAFTFSVVVPIN